MKSQATRFEDAVGQGVRRCWSEGVKTRETRYEDAGGHCVRLRWCEEVKTRATRFADGAVKVCGDDGEGV